MKKVLEFFKKHKKKFIILAIIVIVAIVGLTIWKKKTASNTDFDPTASLTTEQVEKQTISNYVSMTGNIVANDSQTVYATLEDLEVLKIDVEVGDYVNEGDVIAVLDSSTYEKKLATAKKQLEVAQAKSNLSVKIANENLADAQVDAVNAAIDAQTSVDNANTDMYYTQVDYQQACEDLSSAKYNLQYAKDNLESEYNDAKEKYEDAKKKYKKAKKKDSNYDSLKSDYKTKEDTYETWKERYENPDQYLSSYYNAVSNAERSVGSMAENIEKQQRNVDKAVEDQADTALDQQRKLIDATESQTSANLDASIATISNEDQIEELETDIEKCTITAPLSGVITSISLEVGDTTAKDNNEICSIQDTSGYKVEGTVDEYDIAKIAEGQKAVIKTEATGDIEMTGVVSYVSTTPSTSSSSTTAASSSSSTVTYPIKITLDGIDQGVRIGMTAETNIILETAENVLTVPYDCVVQNSKGEDVIYAVREGGFGDFDPSNMPADASTSENAAAESSDKASKPSGGPGRGGLFGGGPGAPGGSDSSSSVSVKVVGKEIVVTKGLETDFYTEVSSNEIYEGMQVYVPEESFVEAEAVEGGFGGGPGGGAPGGGPN